jgi:hypothetical protein
LKKAAQKLLLIWAMGVVAASAHGPESKKFGAGLDKPNKAYLSDGYNSPQKSTG